MLTQHHQVWFPSKKILSWCNLDIIAYLLIYFLLILWCINHNRSLTLSISIARFTICKKNEFVFIQWMCVSMGKSEKRNHSKIGHCQSPWFLADCFGCETRLPKAAGDTDTFFGDAGLLIWKQKQIHRFINCVQRNQLCRNDMKNSAMFCVERRRKRKICLW